MVNNPRVESLLAGCQFSRERNVSARRHVNIEVCLTFKVGGILYDISIVFAHILGTLLEPGHKRAENSTQTGYSDLGQRPVFTR